MFHKPGQRIAKLRKEKRLTQSELAYTIKKTLRTVQFYEKGKVEPPASTLNLIAKALGVRVEWLLTGEGEMQAGGEGGGAYPNGGVGSLLVREGPGVSLEERELLEALREDPEALEQVRLYLQAKHLLGASAQVTIVVTPKAGE